MCNCKLIGREIHDIRHYFNVILKEEYLNQIGAILMNMRLN